jgi:sulfhydrogenase subunit beta (sulfur reductase)
LESKIVNKKDISSLLDRLIRLYRVYAPVRRNGLFLFEAVKLGADASLDYPKTKMSPKAVLFPESEDLFHYQSKGRSTKIGLPPLEDHYGQILFGIRPCDAKGIQFLDRFFGGDPSDPYYQERRSKTVIVSLGCRERHNGCFCTTLGGSPCAEDGSDLLLIDIGDEYLVRILSEKGAALIKDEDMAEAREEQIIAAAEVAQRAEEAVSPSLELEGAGDRLIERFNDPVWDTISEKCVGCGVCTYLCPTCHCFDICDEVICQEGTRIRIWDSCQYSLFTKEASGHNPRNTQGKRMRRRIMHKFKYLPEKQDMWGCTGCGRCVTECPVNLDIRQVLTILLKGDEIR